MIKELEQAKKNVIWLVGHPTGSVDMKGLVYWAEVVVDLRKKLSEI